MNLGEKLKAANEARATAANEAEIAKREADAAKFELDNSKILHEIERIKISITRDIESGVKVHPVKLPMHSDLFNTYSWKKHEMTNCFEEFRHPHYNAIDSFFRWADDNGLRGKFIYQHDGMGIESWYVATVEPK